MVNHYELKRPNQTPSGGWVYHVSETNTDIRGASLEILIGNVKQHCLANNIPVRPHGEQTIIDAICVRCPDNCRAVGNNVFTLAFNFAAASARWVSSGFKVITEEEFGKRLAICEPCPNWKGEAGFGMGRCGKCGCVKVKLYLASEKCPLPVPLWKEQL